MALSAAERQRRHRDRIRAALARVGAGLSDEQIADRDAVMADPLWPVPSQREQAQIPTFMGWTRHDWSAAPEALVDHFGMRSAWEAWQAEERAMEGHTADIAAERQERAEAIIAECGEPARQLAQRDGQVALFRAYEAGEIKPKRKRASRS